MPKSRPPSSRELHQARAACWLGIYILLSCVFVSGCVNQRRPPSRQPSTPAAQVPLDAYTLSGGKITQFVSLPGSNNDPTDKMLLAAFGLSLLKGSSARSALVTFQTSAGNNLVGGLVINNNVLVSLDDFTRQAFGWEQLDETKGSFVTVRGIPYFSKPFLKTNQGEMFLYKNSPQYIQITPGSQIALVGGKRISLRHPVLWQNGQHPLQGNHVMLLSDLLLLFKEHDKQTHSTASIRKVKLVYDIRDYQR